MTIAPWPAQRAEETAALRAELDAVTNALEVVTESWVDAEFAAEDRGWIKLGAEMQNAFTRQGIYSMVRNSRLMSVVSPLLKRGLQLRKAYVFGQGVELGARDPEINALVQDFLDDPMNRRTFSSAQARETGEGMLGTDGNVFLALPTSPLYGRVQVRIVPFDEIRDIVKNPDDREDDWYYLREWNTTTVEDGYAGTRTRWARQRAYHPALNYFPADRPTAIDGIPVYWDTPIDHTHVNRIPGTKWGIPDAYAALPWARAYEGFLTDWARLMKALSRFAWKLTGDKGGKADRAAARLRDVLPSPDGTGVGGVGGVAAYGPGTNLEAIPKSGATIDADSGKPLAALVAASLGVSVVSLIADPGTTGARAVAETLDKPTVLEMSGRREVWTETYRRILTYVVAQSIKAPRGAVAGTVTRDEYGRERIDLGMTTPAAGEDPEERDARLEINWPSLDELSPLQLVQAIVSASDTGHLPAEVIARLLLSALPVRDPDEILEDMMDENGDFVDPGVDAAAKAVAAFRGGQLDGPPAGE